MSRLAALWHRITWRHKGAAAGLLIIAAAAALLWITRFNVAAVVPVATFLSAIPLAVSFSLQTVLQGIAAGVTLRREGLIRPGRRVSVNGIDGTVAKQRLRVTEITTSNGTLVEPNTVLLSTGIIVDATQSSVSNPKE